MSRGVDRFDVSDSATTLNAEHLRTMKDFVTSYSTQLRELEDNLTDRISEVWDSASDPISILAEPYEAKRVQDLFSSDNKPFDKTMTVFAYLCWEIRSLRDIAAERFYTPLSLFGEVPAGEDGSDEPTEGESHMQVGSLMKVLQDLQNFIQRASSVGQNLVQQLANLYSSDKSSGQLTSFSGIHVATIFEHLADLCAVFISLDEIIDNNENISEAWTSYKKMLKTIGADPARFGTDAETLERFENYMNIFEDELLDGRIFPTFTDQEFTLPGKQNIASNAPFMAEFFDNVSKMTQMVDSLFEPRLRLGRRSLKQGREVMGLFGLFILFCRMSRAMPDKKLYKELYYMYSKVPAVVCHGRTVFLPQDLLTSLVPPPPGTVKLVDLTNERKAYLLALDQNIAKSAEALHQQVSSWMVKLDASMAGHVRGEELYRSSLQTGDLLVRGVMIAQAGGFLLRTYMNMHLELAVPFFTSAVKPIAVLVEVLQSLSRTFKRRHGQVALRLTLVTRHVSRYLGEKLAPMRAKLEKTLVDNKNFRSKRAEGSMVDMLSAVRLMINLLDGCVGPERLLVLNLTWELFAPRGRELCTVETLRSFDEQLWKLGILVRCQQLMDEACDVSFLYYQMQLLPTILQNVYEQPETATRMQYVVSALDQVALMLKNTCHEGGLAEGAVTLHEDFKAEVLRELENVVIKPLCRDVENDLRLHIHSSIIVKELQQYNPVKQGVKDLSRFFLLPPLRFCGVQVSIRDNVAHYLNTTFYNMTTVALHNWMTYGEMRNLAREKFGLELTDGYLPGGTLQQGLDVLEIMRNIHIFVSRYNYNLNAQFFVESDTETRHLNTINIQHIANSIRTHGIGMMNTTVNYTYQFLVQKFMIFSQFLYDDNIKSRLIKDVRFYKLKRKEMGNKYPYTRAESFIKSIKKLGQVGGMDYLGQFRKLITEIGNALGYVRMIRSGGLRYCSNASAFIPDLKKDPDFNERASTASLPAETTEACKLLDDVVQNLMSNSAEGVDYFGVMVKAFAELRHPDNEHLKNFFVIIPPLMISFVDHMLIQKDRMGKKGKFGCFTDDGFAIGVAYILAVLKQNGKFDSLHWFDAIAEEFKSMEAAVRGEQADGKDRDAQAQHMLKLQKLTRRTMEFDLLYYAFNGARIFFRDA